MPKNLLGWRESLKSTSPCFSKWCCCFYSLKKIKSLRLGNKSLFTSCAYDRNNISLKFKFTSHCQKFLLILGGIRHLGLLGLDFLCNYCASECGPNKCDILLLTWAAIYHTLSSLYISCSIMLVHGKPWEKFYKTEKLYSSFRRLT
jgi:hypothetical protein